MENPQFSAEPVRIEKDSHAAEDSLEEHAEKRRDTEPAKPPTLLLQPEPSSEDGREQPDSRGNQAV